MMLSSTTLARGPLLLSLFSCLAQAQTGADVMAAADRLNRPKFEVSRMQMELADASGRVTQRDLVWYFRNEGGRRTSLMKFSSPAAMRGVGILVIEEKGVPNAIWHYLPATRNVRRISPEHRQNRFMGTEFIFEDFEGLKLDQYTFTLIGTEACGEAAKCDVVEGRASDPAEAASSSYGKKVFYVDKQSHAIVKTALYDKSGKLAKLFETSGWRRLGEYWRPQLQTMSNLADKRVTRLREVTRKLDEPFETFYTSQQYLRSE